ncbi:MAG: hypothetical protein JNJ85_11850 [Candidatus Kapabacteria bacterium]|nr:hypothetical protein [Candidatus Kapabacteria bacterium]
MIKLIVLSQDRASQCDVLLSSIFSRFEAAIPYSVTVVFGASNEHYAEGYTYLQKKYSQQNVEFKNIVVTDKHHSSAYTNVLNLARILRDSSLSKKKTNFKEVLESSLTGSSHIGLFTDECIIYKQMRITTEILNLLSVSSSSTTFSTRLGMNVIQKPQNIRDQTRYCLWNSSNEVSSLWSESFSVKGNLYDAEFLIEFLRPLYYNSVQTLEKYASESVKKYKALQKNYCFHRQRVVEVHIDEAKSFSRKEINNEYIQGNELHFVIPDAINKPSVDAINVGFNVGAASTYTEVPPSVLTQKIIHEGKHKIAYRTNTKVGL